MRRMFGSVQAAVVAALMVAACGGGGTDPAAALRSQAAETQRELLVLANPTPCANDNQCGLVYLQSTVASCGATTPVPYSLLSSTAAAVEELARQQNALAKQAIAAEDAPPLACPAVLPLGFRAACMAGECKATPASAPVPAPAG